MTANIQQIIDQFDQKIARLNSLKQGLLEEFGAAPVAPGQDANILPPPPCV
jgi:hypothetical protein